MFRSKHKLDNMRCCLLILAVVILLFVDLNWHCLVFIFLFGSSVPDIRRYQSIPQVSLKSFTDADRLDCLLLTAIANN